MVCWWCWIVCVLVCGWYIVSGWWWWLCCGWLKWFYSWGWYWYVDDNGGIFLGIGIVRLFLLLDIEYVVVCWFFDIVVWCCYICFCSDSGLNWKSKVVGLGCVVCSLLVSGSVYVVG